MGALFNVIETTQDIYYINLRFHCLKFELKDGHPFLAHTVDRQLAQVADNFFNVYYFER
jgi:hypothetical protein